MYELFTNPITGQPSEAVKRLADHAFIPFDPANTDYQTFKKDLGEGVELKDADGNDMTADEVAAFLAELP